jgi:hypothetical protein
MWLLTSFWTHTVSNNLNICAVLIHPHGTGKQSQRCSARFLHKAIEIHCPKAHQEEKKPKL